MLCRLCRDAAWVAMGDSATAKDMAKKIHAQCKGCTCQHKENAQILKEGYVGDLRP